MSISGQNLTLLIVTLKSEKIIDQCIKSINKDVPIIVVENSDDQGFKNKLESKYKNLKCILAKSNLGMGAGNNIGIREAKTDFVLILNPDVILESNTLDELFLASSQLSDFSILAPQEAKIPNYGIINKDTFIESKQTPFKVHWVDGFAMLLNKKKIKE